MPPFDPDLLQLVERCVVAYERDGETALDAVLANAGALADEARQHVAALQRSGLLQPPETPTRIGPWRILQRIGSGGMGAVYLGEQSAPLRRRAAVKLIRRGMDSGEVLARFAIEQKALLMLDHPGIARILDAGKTGDGRPYIAMEYVKGLPLLRYCDERQLDMPERLLLFVRVCDAVQHAHHKGLLHRDLKQSNILVTDRDGQALPVVIDFGVAKSVGNPLADATQLTLPGRLLGTPEYMSPEQATNEADVDTRTDVYSLGVILYELLTGMLPFDGRQLRGGDLGQLLRDSEPPTPSTRLTALGERAIEIASLRQSNPASLRRLLRGDLDAIVMKALDRDRNRRYGMPAEFARDIERHLRNEAVTAGAPSRWLRLRKDCARHRLSVTAAALVVSALGTGLAMSTVFYREAAASSVAASRNLDAALEAVGELVQVGATDLVAVPHLEEVRRDLLQRSVEVYLQFLDHPQRGDARILPRTIEAMLDLGRIQHELGESDAGLTHFREATRLLASPELANMPASEHLELSYRATYGRALCLARTNRREAGREAAHAATELARRLLEQQPGEAAALSRLAGSLHRESTFCDHTMLERRLQLLDEALANAQRLLPLRKDDRETVATVVSVAGRRAETLLDLGRREQALKVVAPMRALHATVDARGSWALARAMIQVAEVSWRSGAGEQAIEVVETISEELETFARNHPAVVAYRSTLVELLMIRANAELDLHRFAAAVDTQRRIQDECADALQHAPDDLKLKRSLALSCSNMTTYQNDWRGYGHEWDAEQVLATIDRGLAVLDSMPAEAQSDNRQPRMELMRVRGAALDSLARLEDAVTASGKAVRIGESLVEESASKSSYHRARLGAARREHISRLLALDRIAEAAPLVEAALADSEATRDSASMKRRWIAVHRSALMQQARIRGSRGDVDGMVASLQRHKEFGSVPDWIGFMGAVNVTTRVLRSLPPADPARAGVYQRGLFEADGARQCIATNRERGSGHGTLAVMSYRTETAVLDLNTRYGDPGGIDDAIRRTMAAAVTLRQVSPSTRNDRRLTAAIVRCATAAAACDEGVTAGIVERVAQTLSSQPLLLADAAASCCAESGQQPAARASLEEVAIELLRRAAAAGLPSNELDGERFGPLRARDDFAELRSKSGG